MYYNTLYYTNVIQIQNYKPILKKKGHFYCQNFGFIYINQCFSHKISYFFEIRIVNVHISIKVFVSNKINLVKITPVKEISTFRTSYFSHQVQVCVLHQRLDNTSDIVSPYNSIVPTVASSTLATLAATWGLQERELPRDK